MLLAGISLREREHRGSLYLRSNRVCSCLHVEVAHFLERPATGTLGTHDSDTLRRSRSAGLFPVDQPSVDCTTHITVYTYRHASNCHTRARRKAAHERHPPAVTLTHLGGELSTFGGGTHWGSAFAMSLSLLSRVSSHTSLYLGRFQFTRQVVLRM